jgi:hypothetical protein
MCGICMAILIISSDGRQPHDAVTVKHATKTLTY